MLETDTMETLLCYDWPGNVRELENELERAVALGFPGTQLSPYLLSEAVRSHASSVACGPSQAGTLRYETERLERKKILEPLDSCMWNKTHSARLLGLSRQGLLKKMRRFGLADKKPTGKARDKGEEPA